jgi:phage I-like protein
MPSEPTTAWANIGRVSTLQGASGPISLTVEMFDDIVRNAERRVAPLNVDYDFATHRAELSGPKPSAGTVREVKRCDDRLWARIELSVHAVELLVSGQYTHCVMLLALDAIDRTTGEQVGAEMLSASLTKEPLDTELYPIRFDQESPDAK